MSGMSDDEIDAIAKHEHIPALIALELGNRLLETPEGTAKLRDFIVDDLLRAQERSDCAGCAKFGRVLGRYLEAHPDCSMSGAHSAGRLAGMIAIGLVARLRESGIEPPREARVLLSEIDEAIRRADCPACGDSCLRLLRALDG
jgi:hypothetical protein